MKSLDAAKWPSASPPPAHAALRTPERQLEKTYGALVADLGRSQAENFFPKNVRSSRGPLRAARTPDAVALDIVHRGVMCMKSTPHHRAPEALAQRVAHATSRATVRDARAVKSATTPPLSPLQRVGRLADRRARPLGRHIMNDEQDSIAALTLATSTARAVLVSSSDVSDPQLPFAHVTGRDQEAEGLRALPGGRTNYDKDRRPVVPRW
ncbi:MAG: hypothetical protein U0325_05425 [Polyangiales bacterium]